jgi:hypothetical protein
MTARAPLASTIPADVRALVGMLRVVEVGFGAGPGFMGQWRQKCDPSLGIDEALEILEPRRDVFRRAHIQLEDGTTLFFEPAGYLLLRDPPKLLS